MANRNKVVARKVTRMKTKLVKRYTGKNIKRLMDSLVVHSRD